MLDTNGPGQGFGGGGKGMIGGHGEDEAQFAKGCAGEAAPGRRVATGAHHQVGAAVGEGVPAAAEGLGGEADAGTPVFGVEAGEQVQEGLPGQEVVHGDNQLSLPALGHLAHPAFQAAGGG